MRLPLPTSSIINFAAFILLFAVITLLYHIGGRIETRHKPTDTKSAPQSVTAAATVSDNAAKIIETEQEPTPEKPKMYAVKALPSRHAPLQQSRGIAAGELERLITVEELDSEEARRGYLAANRKIGTRDSGPGIRNPKPENHEAYFPTGNLFIPFEKRK